MNMQPGSAATPTQVVACAVKCCDRKNYVLKKPNREESQSCSRLGTKKHSCVTHAIREHKNGRMTTKTKPGLGDVVAPSKTFPIPMPDGTTYNAKPDTIVNGNKSIDVKFPCDSEKVAKKNKGLKNNQAAVYPSTREGRTMMGRKERDVYTQIDGITSSRTMTPEMAEDEAHEDCKCN